MKSILYKYVLTLLCIITSLSALATDTASSWKELTPGLSYKKLSDFSSFPSGSIHAFQIDPKLYDFQIALTEKNNTDTSVHDLMTQQKAVIAINGGFFTPEMKSLGLRVSQYKELSPLKSTSWWGVFFIKDNKAYIIPQKSYHRSSDINFAIQAGPRLLSEGKTVPHLKPGTDYRTALGIQPSGKVILLATENVLLSTEELADIMRRPEDEGGLHCIDALNLDGGSSTQLYTQLDNLPLFLAGFGKVADAILILPKKQLNS